jgi:serine/threonine protein phosphatase PrpC
MAFEIDIGYVCEGGRKEPNEDFCAAMLPPAGQTEKGSIVAIADGVSTGGMGREAAQTTVTSLVRDYYGTPETWDTTVALDRVIGAQNTWLVGVNRRRRPQVGLTTLTAVVLRGQTWTLAHVGDTRAYLLRVRPADSS